MPRGHGSCLALAAATITAVAAALHFSGDPEADALLAQEPLALLVGFVLGRTAA